MEQDYSILYIIAIVLFWTSVGIILYSYLIFPILIGWMASGKKLMYDSYSKKQDLPKISLLISAYNEEEVIADKIHSIFTTSYPVAKLEVLVGSDCSTDKTNRIMSELTSLYPQLKFYPFSTRRGKGNVVNDLYNKSNGEVLILSDANVMLDRDTLFELVKYFKDSRIGLVDSRMINTHLSPEGISRQEKAYISREVEIKQNESILWGTMMGPFGGCYALRASLYEPIPKNFLVDDFFINMKVLEKKYHCINNTDARVYEDISNNIVDEFKRKVRISTGNFQNLRYFSKLLFDKTKGLSFCFISHKVLRWIGPLFLILAFLTNMGLAGYSTFYFLLFIFHCLLFVLPLFDIIFKKLRINLGLLRFVTHFYSMNLALLAGFFKTFKNIESNVWKPTKRNQA